MRIIIASKNTQLKNRLLQVISKFDSVDNELLEIIEFNSYLELINESNYEENIILTDESLINSQEELHFLKILKNKNAAGTLIHVFNKHVPFTLDEFIVNSVSKFLKDDINLEFYVFKSLSALLQNELKKAHYVS